MQESWGLFIAQKDFIPQQMTSPRGSSSPNEFVIRSKRRKINRQINLVWLGIEATPQNNIWMCLKKKILVNILKHTETLFPFLLLLRRLDNSKCEREERARNPLAAWRFVVVARTFSTKAQRERIFSFSWCSKKKAVWWESSNGYDGIPLLRRLSLEI